MGKGSTEGDGQQSNETHPAMHSTPTESSLSKAGVSEKASSLSKTDTSVDSSSLIESTSPDDPNAGGNSQDTVLKDGDENLPNISYFSLYRYASRWEKAILGIGIFVAAISGIIPAMANATFGAFIKAMVAKGSNITQCPPPPSSKTSEFMTAVEDFTIRQCSLGAMTFVGGYILVACFNSVAENQIYKIRKKYFEKLLRQDVGWFDKNAKRDFTSRLVEDMLKIQDAISEKVGMLVMNISNAIFLIGVAFYFGWKLSSALMVLFPILGLITGFNARVSSQMTEKEQSAYSEAGAIAEEVFTNIKTVNAFNGQDKEAKRYKDKILKAKTVAIRKHVLIGLGNGLMWFICYANFAFAFWYGTHLVLKSRESGDGTYGVDNILVIFFSILFAGTYIGDSSQYFQLMAEGKGAAKGIFPVLNRESAIDSLSTTGLIPRERALGEIEFEDVKFSYPTRPSVKILQKLNIVIRSGQTVALVGKSGCGKSTCIALLERLYDPASGRVKLDGVDLKELNISWLRSQCGLVGQEPVLFNTTIAENIKYGLDSNISHEDIVRVAKMAYAHEFISQLPLGYDTECGERGAQLSGGQKQRIAIARALIRNPPILLLDEATSALDFQSEAIVQAALERARAGRTTIIVAHRLSTIKAADMVVAIDNGQVKECGSHDELMGLKGLYYKLVMSQEDKEELSLNPEEFLKEEREFRNAISQEVFEDQHNVVTSCSPAKLRSRSRLSSDGSLEDTTALIHDNVKVVDSAVTKGGIWRLWKMNFNEWPYILASVVCTVLKGLQLPVYAYIFGRFIQIFTIKDDFEVQAKGDFFAMMYTIIAALVGIDGFLQFVFIGIAGESFTYRIRNTVFSSVLKQDMTFYDESENTVGNLCARLSTDSTSIRGVTSGRLSGLIQATTIVLAAGAMSFILIPKLSAVAIVFVPVMIYAAFMEGRVLRSDNVIEKESIEKSCNLAVEALNNIRTVASLCAEKTFIKLYEEALADSHRINRRRSHIRGLVYAFVNSGSYFCYSLSLLYGGYLVENECVSIGDVFTVAEALIFCTTSGGAALAFAADYDKGKIAAARILKLLDRIPLVSRFSSIATVARPEGKIEFDKVTFYYKNRPSVRVLKNLDLVAKHGGNVALVGPSGSGKSTCAALILRFYDPASGQVRFDDNDLKDINLDHLRQQLAIVSQEPVLFDCTIGENIAYGDTTREVSMDEIIKAAKMANIHDFISSLPAGYETRLGSLGNQLSGGQKQRVAIARALIRRPKVLVLDEATSALDTESERVVQEALDVASAGRTSITIAHRLTSIQNADQIIVMKNGSVREVGTHTELLVKGGLYRDMWLAQKLQCGDGDDNL